MKKMLALVSLLLLVSSGAYGQSKDLILTFNSSKGETNLKYKDYGAQAYLKFNSSLDRSTSMFWIDTPERQDSVSLFLNEVLTESIEPLIRHNSKTDYYILDWKIGAYRLKSFVTQIVNSDNLLVLEYDNARVYISRKELPRLVDLVETIKRRD